MKLVSPTSTQTERADALDLDHLLEDRRWQPLLDLLPDGLVLVDRTGFVRFINSAAENISQLLRVEVVDRSLQDFVKQSKVECRFAWDGFETGAKNSNVVMNSMRQRYLLSTRCIRDYAGEMTCFVIVMRDFDQFSKIAADDAAMIFAEVRENRTSQDSGDSDESMVLSEANARLLQRGVRALELGSRLLLLGESGSGKTELARALHRMSGAAGRPFIHVNCGSIPESLFESEMFGYERGSFTGASAKGKKGLVEAAERGVLFLDEIGEIPLSAQAKMLQFLEDSTIHRVGATQIRRLRVQIIAATNRDLYQMVGAGTFRQDLYYRLSVVTLTVPPLRECSDVIDKLIERILGRLNRRRPTDLRLDNASRRRLRTHDYPGNVRELQNLLEHFAVVCDRVVTEADVDEVLSELRGALSKRSTSNEVPAQNLRQAVRDFESRIISETIERTGSKRKAAEVLGVDIATVVRKSRPVKDDG